VSHQALIFRDRFIHEAVQTVERRRKGLASRGELTVSGETTGDGERALLIHAADATPVVVLALSAGRRADVYLCAPEQRRIGKVLVKIEGLVLGGDVKRLLATLEWTIGAARRLDPHGRSLDAGHLDEIVRRWRTLHQGAVA
jgi:hypothetical protein